MVVISTAHGLKFVEMKVKYHQRELEFPSRHANQPIELPARLDAVKEALHKALQTKAPVPALARAAQQPTGSSQGNVIAR